MSDIEAYINTIKPKLQALVERRNEDKKNNNNVVDEGFNLMIKWKASHALCTVCEFGTLSDIIFLVDVCDADLKNATTYSAWGRNCLHRAVLSNNLDVVRYLVNKIQSKNNKKKGKSNNSSNKNEFLFNAFDALGKTPLDLACQTASFQIVKFLFLNGAIMEESGMVRIEGLIKRSYNKETSNMTCLEVAILGGDFRLVKYLVENEGYLDLSIETERKLKVLSNALAAYVQPVRYLLDEWAIRPSHPKELELILETKSGGGNTIDKNAPGRECLMSLLHRYSQRRSYYCTQQIILLFKLGGNVNAKTNIGITALHFACYKGLLDAVKILCKHGANVNTQECLHGKTPLHFALQWNHPEIAMYLLTERGADPNIEDKNGLSPFYYAYKYGVFNVATHLFETQSLLDASSVSGEMLLNTALRWGHSNLALHLMKEKGVNGGGDNIKDKYGLSPLHYACGQGALEVVEHLLGMASVNLNEKRTKTQYKTSFRKDYEWDLPIDSTPLHFVFSRRKKHYTLRNETSNYLRIMDLLISHGADITAQDENGQTPLHQAFWFGCLDSVSILFEAGGTDILRAGNWSFSAFTCIYYIQKFYVNFGISLVKKHPVIASIFEKEFIADTVERRVDPEFFKCVTSSETGNLPIHDACRFWSKEGVIEYMIEKYPEGLRRRNALGRLPLHEFCGSNSTHHDQGDKEGSSHKIITALFHHYPAALTVRDNFGKLPIEIAIANIDTTSLDVVYFLLTQSPSFLQEVCRE